MPISVVVGGQYGSEGKGKVALELARREKAAAVVRVGGPNSGHTGIDTLGNALVLRQLPASALAPTPIIVLPAGSLIDIDILMAEIAVLDVPAERLFIDARASVITSEEKETELNQNLIDRIGSTGSGTGAALQARLKRESRSVLAGEYPRLSRYVVASTSAILRSILNEGKRIVIEGTQGFGLSVWHSPHYPFVTSRDTTAASFVAESGLAPHDVEKVILVIRSYPIRVGGNSGPLKNELSWEEFNIEADLSKNFREYTSATKRLRRIARFDPEIVKLAIDANNPTEVVLNHLDYVDKLGVTGKSLSFVRGIEASIQRPIDYLGFGPSSMVENPVRNPRKVANAS